MSGIGTQVLWRTFRVSFDNFGLHAEPYLRMLCSMQCSAMLWRDNNVYIYIMLNACLDVFIDLFSLSCFFFFMFVMFWSSVLFYFVFGRAGAGTCARARACMCRCACLCFCARSCAFRLCSLSDCGCGHLWTMCCHTWHSHYFVFSLDGRCYILCSMHNYLRLCLSDCLCLSVCLSVFTVCVCVYVCVYLSVCVCLYVCLFA